MIKLTIYVFLLTVLYAGIKLFADVENPSFATLQHDSIHCEIGHNNNSGTRGVIHLWKKHQPDGVDSADTPFDVMENGEYDYVKIDNNWFVEAGENPAANILFGIKDTDQDVSDSTCRLIFEKPQFEVIKDIQPLVQKINNINVHLPVIKVTYSIKNNTNTAHQYTIYHADDYSMGGYDHSTYIGFNDRSYAYKYRDYDSLKVSTLIRGSETKCIISKLNCESPIPANQFYTFLGIADTSAVFYVNYANRVMSRNFVINEDILTYKQISVGVQYNIGVLQPGQTKKVWFYLGVSRSWNSINKLADQVLQTGAVNVSVTPDDLNIPEIEKNYQTTIQIKNNSNLNIHINDITLLPSNIDFVNLTYLNGTPFPGSQGYDISPNSTAFCRLKVVQPDHYKNTISVSFNYEAEGGSSGSVTTELSINRQAPKTTDFLFKGSEKSGSVAYSDQYLVIDGKVDDSQTGSSYLDSCIYYDNNVNSSAIIGAFGLENIIQEFTDKAIPMPQNWAPGSNHKIYFHSKDESSMIGRFFVDGEYDSITVSVIPDVKTISPATGEYNDPVPIEINAGVFDSLTIQWTANIQNPSWTNIYHGTESTFAWISGLNLPQVWLRARVRKGADFSAWKSNSSSILIDNSLPITSDNYLLGSAWQKRPVAIDFSRSDNLSNFDNGGQTYYSLDGSLPNIILPLPLRVVIAQNYNNYLRYYSKDDAGNSEIIKQIKVRADFIAPKISRIALPDLTSIDSTAYRFKLKIADHFSGLKRDSVIFFWRYGDLDWQSRHLNSTDSIFIDSIAKPAAGWSALINSYLELRVAAVDSADNKQNWAYDEYIQFKNIPPHFTEHIPDQTILKLNSFTDIDLRPYISDEQPNLIIWSITHSNPADFTTSLTNGYLFNIEQNTPLTVGRDSVFFRMIDIENALAADTVVFTVLDQNYPPVISNLSGQSVASGLPFATFDLDDFVADPDHNVSQLSWITNAVSPLKITVDPVTHLCTAVTESSPGVADDTIVIDQPVIFTVTDPLNAQDTKIISFKRGNYPVSVLEIDDQIVLEDQSFQAIKMSDYLISQSPVNWRFAFSTDSTNYFANDQSNKFTIDYGSDDSCRVICKADSSGSIFIKFLAADNNGFADSTIAKFSVHPVNDNPFFTGAVNQQIAHQALFTPFNLFRLVSDKETPSGIFNFSVLPSAVFDVQINPIAADSVMAQVINRTPQYNGQLADSLIFVVEDSENGSGNTKFFFKVETDTLTLSVPDQTISLGESFSNYILSNIVSNYVVNPALLQWSFLKLSGDNLVALSIDTLNSQLSIATNNSSFGLEKMEISARDSIMQQTVKDTVTFTISYQNQAPLLVIDPNNTLSINQGEQQFMVRKIFRFDDLTETDSLKLRLKWLSFPSAAVFSYDTLAIKQDTLKVSVLAEGNWSGLDSLEMILTDSANLADTVVAVYEVKKINFVPIVSEFPLYNLNGIDQKKIYLDRYVSDANNSDGEISWSFESSNYLNLDSTGSEPDSGQFVVVRITNQFTGQKVVRFTASDPFGASSNRNVLFNMGINLMSMQISDSTNANPELANRFLNDFFAKATFPDQSDSARAGVNSDLNNLPWLPMRADHSIVFSFPAAKEQQLRDTQLKFYGQVKKDGLESYLARDSIYFDNSAPQSSFYLEALSGSTEYTENDTVRIRLIESAADVYRYAYSKTGQIGEDNLSLFEDSLRQKFVLDDSGWLYITFLDSAGNVYTASDNISRSPVIVLEQPDLKLLQNRGNIYPYANMQISGYDSTGTADTVTIKFRGQKIILYGSALTGLQRRFQSEISLADNDSTSTVFIEAVNANGYRGKLSFQVGFVQKRHFVLTLNSDGYNDYCYFETGNDPKAEVKIFSLRGDFITKIKYNSSKSEPPRWDGRDNRGKELPGGLYLFVVNSNGKESSGTIAIVK